MSILRANKTVSTLPDILEPNTLYFVRTGDGFDLYCSDLTGSIAHKINSSSTNYNDLLNLPTTFPPDSHTHTASEITDFDIKISNNSDVILNTAKISADGSINTHSDVDLTGITINQILKWDGTKFVPSDDSGGSGATNLSYSASATDGTILSDSGSDAVIPAGSTINASLMLPADKIKLDALSSESLEWSSILNKPTVFTPDTHTHTFSEISDVDISNFVLTSNVNQLIYGVKEFENDLYVNNLRIGLGTSNDVNNLVIGYHNNPALTVGLYNVSIGYNAITSNTTGYYNTAIGYKAGEGLQYGSHNIYIGHLAQESYNAVNNEIVIGSGLKGRGLDTTFIGGLNGSYNEKNVTTWETLSDRRIKKNIVDNNTGLNLINKLQVKNFEYRKKEEIEELPSSVVVEKEGVQIGVIAQELKEVLPECVTENSTGVLSVNSDSLIWYLINAVKELSSEVEKLKEEIKNK